MVSTAPFNQSVEQAAGLKASASPSRQLAPCSVAVAIVHYNCLEDTRRCLESLKGLNYEDWFCILLDGASPDGSGAQLHALAEELSAARKGGTGVEVLYAPRNDGFAAGCNLAMGLARARGAEYVWLLNPDTTVAPDALGALVAELEKDSGIGAAGSKVLYAPSNAASARTASSTASNPVYEEVLWSAGAEIDFASRRISMRGNGEVDRGQYDTVFDCGYLPGCSILLRTSLLTDVGFLPEKYFMYFEETDWCVRVRRAGYRLSYTPESRVWHHFNDAKMQNAFTVYYYNRNERLFWFRCLGLKGKAGIVKETLCDALPRSLKALFRAPDDEYREIFGAHVRSCIDFLLWRFGRRGLGSCAD